MGFPRFIKVYQNFDKFDTHIYQNFQFKFAVLSWLMDHAVISPPKEFVYKCIDKIVILWVIKLRAHNSSVSHCFNIFKGRAKRVVPDN